MQLWLQDKVPFTTVTIAYSASSIMAADIVAAIQIVPLPQDTLRVIRGVGGSEAVFIRRVDYLQVGERSLSDFEIEVGGMDYGFEINGILGMDFLLQAGAIINLRDIRIGFAD